MIYLCSFFIFLTGLFHVLFFKKESIDFIKKRAYKDFLLKQEEAEIAKLWAYNQGFYNLFLALGLFFSLYLIHGPDPMGGKLLARFASLSIVGAGLVLRISAPQKAFVALAIQALPALLAFVTSFFF